MELPSKDDKNNVVDKKAKTPEIMLIKANAEKQKNTSEKTRSGFWSRLKNFTAEQPKTVVIENGVEKLVLITPKTTAIPKTVLPKEEPKKRFRYRRKLLQEKKSLQNPRQSHGKPLSEKNPLKNQFRLRRRRLFGKNL